MTRPPLRIRPPTRPAAPIPRVFTNPRLDRAIRDLLFFLLVLRLSLRTTLSPSKGRGAPPSLARARRRRYAALPSSGSRGPQALLSWCPSKNYLPPAVVVVRPRTFLNTPTARCISSIVPSEILLCVLPNGGNSR